MGIRINKVLGYGLTDVRVEGQWRIADPRVNSNSHLLTHVEPEQSYLSYLAELAEGGDFDAELEEGMLRMAGERGAVSFDVCTWDAEYGLPNVLVVRPADSPQWHRRDDPIDYEEECAKPGGTEPRITPTVGGIFPYSGLHMDTRTGERIQDTTVNTWRQVINGKAGSDEERSKILDMLAQVMGYENNAEAEQFIAPWVPDDVRRICTWGGLFTSPEVCFQLRPMIYTYWS
ncbi:hypothetical protein [Streptomyces sp. 5-10]|uniref:hypothetical protein n=1 Tax=Streptomyces sp. 5-10 TaxID=878925 RepID=UPI00168AB341|nr:hypothetical protein [Streptomyces sp. 5-10]MBD3004868.1 hypothetical protein [Streptomyces sp. 5-10]